MTCIHKKVIIIGKAVYFIILLIFIIGLNTTQAQNRPSDDNLSFFNRFTYTNNSIQEYPLNGKTYIKKIVDAIFYDTGYTYLSPLNINLKYLSSCTHRADDLINTQIKNASGFYDLYFSMINYNIPLNYRTEEYLSVKDRYILNRNYNNNLLPRVNEFQKNNYLNKKYNYVQGRIKQTASTNIFFLPSHTSNALLIDAYLSDYDFDNKFFKIHVANTSIDNIFLSLNERNIYTCISVIQDEKGAQYRILIPSSALEITINEVEAENLILKYTSLDKKTFAESKNLPQSQNPKNKSRNNLSIPSIIAIKGKRPSVFQDGEFLNRPIELRLGISIDSLRLYNSRSLVNHKQMSSLDFIQEDVDQYLVFVKPKYINILYHENGDLLFKKTFLENPPIKNLYQSPLDQTSIKSALSIFRYSKNYPSIEEAEVILNFLGADSIKTHKEPNNFCIGYFTGLLNGQNIDYSISIWPNSYNKMGVYGIRYGNRDLSYHGSNDTYFEIETSYIEDE